MQYEAIQDIREKEFRNSGSNVNNKICFEVRATALRRHLYTERFPLCPHRTFHKGTSTEELQLYTWNTLLLSQIQPPLHKRDRHKAKMHSPLHKRDKGQSQNSTTITSTQEGQGIKPKQRKNFKVGDHNRPQTILGDHNRPQTLFLTKTRSHR